MRRQLATLLRKLADRLYPNDLITMTITDNSTGVIKRYHYRTKTEPIATDNNLDSVGLLGKSMSVVPGMWVGEPIDEETMAQLQKHWEERQIKQ